MAHFIGFVDGQSRTDASRISSKRSGLRVTAASWEGAVHVTLWYDADKDCDMARVALGHWHGHGIDHELYVGPVGGSEELLVLLALEPRGT